MGKISPVSAKYIINASIQIDGIVDKPDVIGAIFGQTEGLLGADLELRELQRSGRIGRIEVNSEIKAGKARGTIIIPSSLDKAETCVVGAALEIIQRIGPCNAKIKVENIEDVRISKRHFVVERAKELLKSLIDTVMPDSQEITDEVAYSVRVMEICEYGKDRLPAGPALDDSDEIIVVEGRADVLNLLKHGIKNSIAINGTSVPETIIEICKRKTVTAFVDGDRGGNLIIKELTEVSEIDFVAQAPDGKEVEEITQKEILKALRSRISVEQAKLELVREGIGIGSDSIKPRPEMVRQQVQVVQNQQREQQRNDRRDSHPETVQRPRPAFQQQQPSPRRSGISQEERKTIKDMAEQLIGTRGAYILDDKMAILGKVPITELQSTLKSIDSGINAIVFDGVIERDIVRLAEHSNVKHLIGMDIRVRPGETRINLININDLQ